MEKSNFYIKIINKIEESNNPGKIPNSLITNPEKNDPNSP